MAFGPRIDAAKQKVDFWEKRFESHLGDYLNHADTAKRLFDASAAPEGEGSVRSRRLWQMVSKLEEQELLHHALAGYEIRAMASEYSPPVHLQQLRKALVSKDEMKRVAQVLKHVPARQLEHFHDWRR